MKIRKRTRTWWRGGGAAVLAVAGCNAQVGTEYAGEPLFRLEGTVVLSDESPDEVVPVVAFYTAEGLAVVDAEVTGEFPAQFRLDLLVPPPEEALFSAEEYQGKMSMGLLAVASREHGDSVPYFMSVPEDAGCEDDAQECTEEVRKCTDDGRCYTRTLSCTYEPCSLVFESGDASTVDSFTPGVSAIEYGRASAYAINERCSESGCYRSIHRCDLPADGGFASAWSSGRVKRCEVASESGDERVAAVDVLEHMATGYSLIYATEPNELPRYGKLARGYNLIEAFDPPEEDWIRDIHCRYDAYVTAVGAYNQANGTEYFPYEHVEDEADEAITAHQEALKSECPVVPRRRVVDPLEAHLTFTIGRDPGVL